MRAALLRLERWFAPVVGSMLGLFVLYVLEMSFAPPVTDFLIERLERQSNVVVVSGTYLKHRPCELITTNVMAVGAGMPSGLVYSLKLGDAGSNMPVGPVRWGPYRMPVPPTFGDYTHIEVTALHRCHALWPQQTKYIRLPVGLFAKKE